jgi:hypothetical protein
LKIFRIIVGYLMRSVLMRQSWSPRAPLLVLDAIHKMANWKTWLKGVIDGRPAGHAILLHSQPCAQGHKKARRWEAPAVFA